MKTRVIRRDGYENGAALAQAWQEDGLIPMPHGEVFRVLPLVDKEAVERLGDEEGMQGPELNLLEPFTKHARLMGREQDVARIREWTEPRLLDAVGDIHRERLAEPFDPHRFPEMQGLAQYQDREAKGSPTCSAPTSAASCCARISTGGWSTCASQVKPSPPRRPPAVAPA